MRLWGLMLATTAAFAFGCVRATTGLALVARATVDVGGMGTAVLVSGEGVGDALGDSLGVAAVTVCGLRWGLPDPRRALPAMKSTASRTRTVSTASPWTRGGPFASR